jgi:two-component system, OmpR family, sensor histidine kinase KdpD
MTSLRINSASKKNQYLISILMVCMVAAICYVSSSVIGYRVVALLLLVTISLAAMFFDIWPVLLASFLSALLWDFFFIPPHYTFAIDNAEDILLLAMYFVIASLNAVMTNKIRKIEKIAIEKKERENTIKLYNSLLNSLSHELKTPISAIIGASDNLQSMNEKLSDQNKKELIEEISRASLKLNGHVENLLNMSRLEAGYIKLKKDWCDINELIHDVVKGLKEYLDNRAVMIQVKDNLPLFKIDYGILYQALHNLVHNASLYIPKYSVIHILATSAEEKLIIIVEDNGEGFPEDEIGKVFDKFYRVRNTNTGGMGLGLSIVKGFVEAHDGTIKLENVPGGGAKFTIEIPAEISYINNLKNE